MADINVDQSVAYLDAHHLPKSKGKCAHYVWVAIEQAAGGQALPHPLSAKDWGPSLKAQGYQVVQGATPADAQSGDVAVLQAVPGHPDGHMEMFDGSSWVSDFQQHGWDPSKTQAYKKNEDQANFTLYRHPGGTGVHAQTKRGNKVVAKHHHVYVGKKKRLLGHKQADLEGGGNVTHGSASVFVGPSRYAVARRGDDTTDGTPIAVGEDTILVG